VQRTCSDAERIVDALFGPGAVPVKGDGEDVDAKLGHGSACPHLSRLIDGNPEDERASPNPTWRVHRATATLHRTSG
jgi:hypothetical protein